MKWQYLGVVGLAVVATFGTGRAEQCNLSDRSLVKPDLKALAPVRARVVQRNGSRRLYFTTRVANLGRGPLEIHAKTIDTAYGPVTQATQMIRRSNGTTCGHDAGTFEFHASHNHFHLNDFASYELRKDDPYTGEVVARASKVSFCLTDIEPQRGFDGQRQVFANCGAQEGIQGISSGWADVYDDFYPEQYIELDICRTDGGVPPGQYWLLNVADPDDVLVEDNDDFVNNTGVVSVNVPARVGNQPVPWDASCGPPPGTTATPEIQPTPTPTVRLRSTPRPRPTRPPRPVRPPRTPRTPVTR